MYKARWPSSSCLGQEERRGCQLRPALRKSDGVDVPCAPACHRPQPTPATPRASLRNRNCTTHRGVSDTLAKRPEDVWGPRLAEPGEGVTCHAGQNALPLPHGTRASSGATTATQVWTRQQEGSWGKLSLEEGFGKEHEQGQGRKRQPTRLTFAILLAILPHPRAGWRDAEALPP